MHTLASSSVPLAEVFTNVSVAFTAAPEKNTLLKHMGHGAGQDYRLFEFQGCAYPFITTFNDQVNLLFHGVPVTTLLDTSQL